MHAFDRDTTLEPLGEHRWRADLSEDWNIGDTPNGGFLQALTISAMARTLDHPDPLTVTTHFFGRIKAGRSAEIVVEPIRVGRTTDSAMARVIQDGRERLRTLGTFTDLDRMEGATLQQAYPPEYPAPADCLSRDMGDAPFPFMKQFDIRLAPDLAHSSTTEIGGWIRFSDQRAPDLASLAVFADAFPPTVVSLGSLGWVPTIELTVHYRAKPEPGWLQCDFTTQLIRDGHFEEDGLIWDRSGRAVAQSRQLARILKKGLTEHG